MYDVIVIGSGPAGLSAAVYGMRAQLNLLVLEQNPMSGGQITDTYEIDNYLGMSGMNGFDLAMKFEEHAKKLGADIRNEEVIGIDRATNNEADAEYVQGQAPVFHVVTQKETYETKAVIFAMGATHAHLNVHGEQEFLGKGVSYCATCDGAFFRNKTAVVVGGGDVAVEDAIFLARMCHKVYLIHRRNELRATKILQSELFSLKNVEIVWDSVVRSIEGTDTVERVVVDNVKTHESQELETDACFIAVGIVPRTDVCRGLVTLDQGGYIEAGESCETSAPGIFAAGDLRTKRLRQVVTAVADGAVAITSVQDYLIRMRG